MKDQETNSLMLLLWIRAIHPWYAKLSRNITREISYYYSQGLLPCVISGQLLVFNVKTGNLVTAKSGVFAYYRFCLVDRESVVCFHALESREVVRMDLLTGLLTKLPDMKVDRRNAEVLYFQGKLYVFGGLDGYAYLRSCEEFTFKHSQWTDLPEVSSPRHSAWPSQYRHQIYLPPLYSFETIEVFTLSTQSFHTLKPAMPPHYCWVTAVSFLLRNELVILTTEGLCVRWSISTYSGVYEVSQLGEKVEKVMCAPVYCDRDIVWVASAQVMRFNCRRYQVERM